MKRAGTALHVARAHRTRGRRSPRPVGRHAAAWRHRGHTEPDHYLWPACQWGQYDPTQPMVKWDTAWRALRAAAGLPRFRFHDLRHTVITELAELAVADHVLESISGHLSRRMLEHYSHIRIDAKRQALDALDESRRAVHNDGGTSGDAEASVDSPAPPQERHLHPAARGAVGEPHVTVTSQFGVGGVTTLR